MMRPFHLPTILLLSLALSAVAHAGVVAQLACPDAPRAEHIESILLKINGLPTSFRGKEIRLQDARGGLSFARSIEGWTGGGVAAEQVIMMPLPVIRASDLPGDRWPVVVTLVAADGAETRELVDVPLLPTGPAGGVRRVLQVPGGTEGMARRESPASSSTESNASVTPQPTVVARMSEADFLQTPALALAGFDAVELDAHAASSLTADQVAAFVNVGLRVVVRQADAPAGRLGRFVWDRMPADAPTEVRWMTPRESLERPHMVTPKLMQVRSLQVQAEASTALKRILLAVTPVGILLVVLVRLMIRRAAMVLGVVSAVLVIWTGLAIAYAALQSLPARVAATWEIRNVPPAGSATPLGGDAVALRESFTASASLVARNLDIVGHPGEMLWPAVASSRQYFALEQAELFLDHIDGSQRVERMTMHVPSRFGAIIARRSVQPTALTTAFPSTASEAKEWAAGAGMDLAHAWVLDSGYVTPADKSDGVPQLFDEWMKEEGGEAGFGIAGECWFALRFEGSHRYIVSRQAAAGPLPAELVILDCGPKKPADAPATGLGSRPGSRPGS